MPLFGVPSNWQGKRDPEPEPEVEVEPDTDVHDWRREQLERAGYPPLLAAMLAVDNTVDLHFACDLLGRLGYTVEQAWELLN